MQSPQVLRSPGLHAQSHKAPVEPLRVVREGWVLKKRRKMMQGFIRRYFVLYHSGLLSYSVEPGMPFRDQIALTQAAISSARGHKDIHVDSSNATFHMKCLNTEDFDGWMSAFRQFVAPPADGKSLGRKSSIGRVTPRPGHASKIAFMVEEMGLALSELENAVNAWHHYNAKKRVPSMKGKGDKEKHQDTHKFGLFKKAPQPLTGDSGKPGVTHIDDVPATQFAPYERVQAAITVLKAHQAALAKLIPSLPLTDGVASPLPTFTEDPEDYNDSRSPSFASRLRHASAAPSLSDGGSIWYDATDGSAEGAEEFVLDVTPPTDGEAGGASKISTVADNHSSIYHNDSDASDTDDESQHKGVFPPEETASRQHIVRRTELPSGPVGDEGSLFAVFKKNVGKDLSNIAFPVTFNEPLTLLQREAEVVEYYNLLNEATQTQDPVERLCYVAAFAVSGYAHTKQRSSRKGFNPMLAETFEEPRLKFIAEKVSHNPVILAYHAEGDGWQLGATSSGKTKFWGKSLEIIPTGSNYVEIGGDRYEWKKPSSFMRNLMMGTKYLEHSGKMTIENIFTKARCVVEFKENGYWAITNDVSATVYSPSGKVEATLTGKWDQSLARDLGSSRLQMLWKIAPFPKNSLDYYGFTSWGMTLNEITEDLVGKLPPTDSRYRPDVRALEEGDLDTAEAEKLRVEDLQRERRREHQDRKPRWFKQEGDHWVYQGEYWEQRARGWKDIEPLW
ncbi:hypothetical protein DENSPDRAFT_834003 [Dentipellis sp. KUC8613]|nr:hypothetical protein DENSPDRAFT_834003 [Dentipellis sp. KUC8613]